MNVLDAIIDAPEAGGGARMSLIRPCNRRWSYEHGCWQVYMAGCVWWTLEEWDDPDNPPTEYHDVTSDAGGEG